MQVLGIDKPKFRKLCIKTRSQRNLSVCSLGFFNDFAFQLRYPWFLSHLILFTYVSIYMNPINANNSDVDQLVFLTL